MQESLGLGKKVMAPKPTLHKNFDSIVSSAESIAEMEFVDRCHLEINLLMRVKNRVTLDQTVPLPF